MSTPFSRSIRSLKLESFRPPAFLQFLCVVLLLAWLAWGAWARIGLYEVSDRARLQVDHGVHAIQAAVSGRVIRSHLALGRELQEGTVLLELEGGSERLREEEEAARRESLIAQITGLRAELKRERRALDLAHKAGGLAIEEARARFQAAQAKAQFAKEEARQHRLLHGNGLVSKRELLKVRTETEATLAAAQESKMAVERLEAELATKEEERHTRLEQLGHGLAQLQGEIATSEATLRRLRHEKEQRVIRSPVAGRLSEVAELEAGSFVQQGDPLCVVIGKQKLVAVADFLPRQALGRISSGQPARLVLDGFPWVQYGSLEATVSSVGGEPRKGWVRIELDLHPAPGFPIPLDHGLPGKAQVEVERISPVVLLLRLAGGRGGRR